MNIRDLKVPFFTTLFIFLFLFVYTKFAGPLPFTVNSIQTTKTSLFQADGEGKATAIPDTATLDFGVTKNAATVADAQNQVNSATQNMILGLEKIGVKQEDIKTTNYSVYPNYNYLGGKNTINGYTVSQNMELKLSPIKNVNNAIDTITANGANIIGQVSFGFSDQTMKNLQNQARKDAITAAKEKAQSLAQIAGMHLGNIVDIQENTNRPGPILYGGPQPLAADKVASAPTTVTPGENEVDVMVTLSYEVF